MESGGSHLLLSSGNSGARSLSVTTKAYWLCLNYSVNDYYIVFAYSYVALCNLQACTSFLRSFYLSLDQSVLKLVELLFHII